MSREEKEVNMQLLFIVWFEIGINVMSHAQSIAQQPSRLDQGIKTTFGQKCKQRKSYIHDSTLLP